MSDLIAERSIPNIKTKHYPSWLRLSTICTFWSFHIIVSHYYFIAMNGIETGAVEYVTELAHNSNLPNLIVLHAL